MHLFDTHAHLNDPALLENEAEIVSQARQAGVKSMVAVGIDLRSTLQCMDIARRNQGVYASAGIHPNNCHLATDGQWEEVKQLAADPKVVGIGETGLDCYWDDCPLELQQPWFARHIELSFDLEKPLIVHQRESEQQILESLAEHCRDGRIHGILHSFTGSWDMAQTCLEYGMYISFAGMVTFKNAGNLREIAARIPRDRLLVETDSPYLTPHPHRGKRPNQPKMVVHTANCVADTRQVSIEELAALTTENARRVFNLE